MNAMEQLNLLVDRTRGTPFEGDLRKLRVTMLTELGLGRAIMPVPDEVQIAAEIVSRGFGIDAVRLKIAPRGDSIATLARQVAMYVLFEETKISPKAIANGFGKHDRTTVLHACKRIKGMMVESAAFREQIQGLLVTMRAALRVSARSIA